MTELSPTRLENRVPTSRRAVLAGATGNALETFDFSVYAYMAVILGANFFPSTNPTASLLASFATFGVGYFARPAGAIIFGRLGDRRGRRWVLLVTLILMGVSTLAIAALPTHASIGIAAPALLVVLRLLQGFSSGGETTTAAAYLVEWAPRGRRGLFGSFMQVGGAAGMLMGSLTVAICYAVLGDAQMHDWGWRVPFVVAGLLAPLGYWFRHAAEETPAYNNLADSPSSAPSPSRSGALLGIWRAFVFTMFWAVGYYFFLSYLPTFLQREFEISGARATWTSAFAMAFYMVLIPVFGALSDRVGRRPMLLLSCVTFTLLPIPGFMLLDGDRPFVVMVVVIMAMGAMLALYTGPAPATLAEFFPTSQRTSGMAIGYNISAAVFGGFTPFIATWLIEVTGTKFAPLYYLAAAALLAGTWIAFQRETSRDELA